MPTSDDLKIHGLGFGRSLQIVLKSTALFPVEHPAVLKNLEQAFTKLEVLLRGGQPFTFGFSESRVLLNNLLTSDGTLAPLEAAFRKRGIAAISFQPGFTFANFRDLLKIIAVPPKTVVEAGGFEEYLRSAPVSGARIIPSRKRENEDDGSDRMLNVDGESFLTSGGLAGQTAAGSGMISVEVLLKAAGIEDLGNAGPNDILEIVQGVIKTSATSTDVQPDRAVQTLALLIEKVGPERFLTIPGVETKVSDASTRTLSKVPQELASELWESFTAEWLASRLKSASSDAELATTQDEATRVVTRARPATEMGEGVLARLVRLFQEQGLPPRLLAPVREEVTFSALPLSEQKASLIALQQFSPRDLQRILRTIKSLVSENKSADALELIEHCCMAFTSNCDQSELIGSIPDLIRATPANLHSGLVQAIAKVLGAALQRTASSPESHRSIGNCLATLASQACQSEDFETVQLIAAEIDAVIRTGPDAHTDCCCQTRQTLLSLDAIDKIIELCLGNREDSDISRNAIMLFRQFPAAMERVVERLEGESDPAARIRILRLAGKFRHSGVYIAVRRLQDERWFFVRNSCQLLGEMGDPDLVAHLAPVLKHPDERVQQAAFQILQKSHLPGRIRAYAQALPALALAILDTALDEIMFSLDPACIEGLRSLIMVNRPDRVRFITRALQVALIIDPSGCADLIAHVLTAPEMPEAARALAARAGEKRTKK